MPDARPRSPGSSPVPASDGTWVAYAAGRLWRHAAWLRTEGLARLIEEDQLNPLDRLGSGLARWRWRRANRIDPGGAMPVLLVGLQRSGTNMLTRGLERIPAFEVHGENSAAAFHRFRLRPDPVIRALVDRSRHRYVLLKPLCDSHRTADLLDGLGTSMPPRALWVYRSVDGRARSALAKFGDANLRALRAVAAGDRRSWEAQRLSRDSLELIAGFDWDRMDPASAAALFWYVRNRLAFELGLDRRPDVLLVSYDAVVARPEPELRRLCAFLDVPWSGRLAAGIAARERPDTRLDIHPAIRTRCDQLASALDAATHKAGTPS
jgi:hypothetical protein